MYRRMSNYTTKFAPRDFRALPNDDVMFLVDWAFLYKPTGRHVETTAVVRKVVKGGLLRRGKSGVQRLTVARREQPRRHGPLAAGEARRAERGPKPGNRANN